MLKKIQTDQQLLLLSKILAMLMKLMSVPMLF